jgi:putative membrane protein
MSFAADFIVAVVALLHLGFLVLEMFLWKKPVGRRVFGLPPDFMVASASLAANQGLYNGFLAAGLVWGLLLGPAGLSIKVFFLSCVLIAGVFGAVTAKRSILWIQAMPAAVALGVLWITRF